MCGYFLYNFISHTSITSHKVYAISEHLGKMSIIIYIIEWYKVYWGTVQISRRGRGLERVALELRSYVKAQPFLGSMLFIGKRRAGRTVWVVALRHERTWHIHDAVKTAAELSAVDFKGHAPELGPYSNHRWLAINGVGPKKPEQIQAPGEFRCRGVEGTMVGKEKRAEDPVVHCGRWGGGRFHSGCVGSEWD